MPLNLDMTVYDKMKSASQYKQEADNNALSTRMNRAKVTDAEDKIKAQKTSQALSMATPDNWQQVRPVLIEQGIPDNMIPQQFSDEFNKKAIQGMAGKYGLGSGVNAPSSVREYEYFKNLQKDEQDAMLGLKRADRGANLGDRYINIDPRGNIKTQFPIEPKPEQMPAFKADQETAVTNANISAKAAATAQATLGDTLATGDSMLSVLDQMIGSEDGSIPEHKGFRQSVGGMDSRTPVIRDEALDFQALLDQAKGGAFMSAIQSMRGLGQLSNVEGQAATSAATRMKAALSEEGFISAAKEYRAIVKGGMDRARAKASQAPQPEPVTVPQAPVGMGEDQTLLRAKDAITRGANPDQVIQRLMESGYTPEQITGIMQ